jgi:hypothetical protein
MNWRRLMLAGALVGGSLWCLGLVQDVQSQVRHQQVKLNPSADNQSPEAEVLLSADDAKRKAADQAG